MKNFLRLSAAIIASASSLVAQSGSGSDVTGPAAAAAVTFAPTGGGTSSSLSGSALGSAAREAAGLAHQPTHRKEVYQIGHGASFSSTTLSNLSAAE